jgi:hypothetical protein
LISLKADMRHRRHGRPRTTGETDMPTETILVVSLICLAFAIFAATLFYGDVTSRPAKTKP